MKALSVVAVGDVGTRSGFHVGDEAMLEAAVVSLRRRGVRSWTVITDDPLDTAWRYDVQAMNRFGFAALTDDEARDARLAEILAGARTGELARTDPAAAVIAAVAAADGVLIAGGGNLNSTWPEHIYERAALAGIARVLGRPCVASGQTIGPVLSGRHGQVLSELLAGCAVVGVREQASVELAVRLGVAPGRIRLAPDDAVLLPEPDADPLRSLDLVAGGYVAATFDGFPGVTDARTLIDDLAVLIDDVAATTGLPVVLLPHVGTERAADIGDAEVHARIAAAASPRTDVRLLPVLPARECAALTRGAAMTVSTRYHPGVFGLAAGVPALYVAVDPYTAQKMTGVQALAGLEGWCVSGLELGPGVAQEAVEEFWSRRAQIAEHLEPVTRLWEKVADEHWDEIVDLYRGRLLPSAPPTSLECDPLPPSGSWHRTNQAALRHAETFGHNASGPALQAFEDRARLVSVQDLLARARRDRAAALDRVAELQGQQHEDEIATDRVRTLAAVTAGRLDEVRAELAATEQELVGRTHLLEAAEAAVARLAPIDDEYHRLQATRLLRWSERPRSVYRRLRGPS